MRNDDHGSEMFIHANLLSYRQPIRDGVEHILREFARGHGRITRLVLRKLGTPVHGQFTVNATSKFCVLKGGNFIMQWPVRRSTCHHTS